jgi:AcrR family transcriptional regulator
MPRVVDREARRAALVSAATAVFARQGVANTAVSDIVKAAGVAQGTFYLYFDSKDDAVLAVVDRIAEGLLTATTEQVLASESAVDKIMSFSGVLSEAGSEPGAAALVDLMHLPENRLLHDRLAEDMTGRLVPLLREVVEQGVAEGDFAVDDPQAAAWFVLAGLRSVELSGTPLAGMPAALAKATAFALRALGHTGAQA